jgi:hypothetical protein
MPVKKREFSGLKTETSRAEFRIHNGVPALFLRGKPVAPLMIDVAADTPATQIVAIPPSSTRLFRLRHVGLGWMGVNQYDHSVLEERVGALLAAAPGVAFILEVAVDAPEWWRRANPAEGAGFAVSAETAVEAPGRKKREKSTENSEEAKDAPVPICASWASRRWLNEAGDALLKLAQHVMRADWAEQCIGFQVACGEAGGWIHPDAERMPDIGPRMAEKFRAFCVEKYRRNTGLLRKGWDDPRADFDRIRCPDAYERRYADMGVLRDPLRSRRMLDYYECFYGTQNEAALHFCGLLKKATQNQCVVGLAYASPFGQEARAEGVHGMPEAVFDSPDVDFIVDATREQGEIYSSTFNGSLALRGKFLFHAAQASRSTLFEMALAQSYQGGLIVPASAQTQELALMMKISEQGVNAPAYVNKRAAQVAVIVDALGPTYFAGKDDVRAEWYRAIMVDQLRELAQTGAPFDVYLLSDFFHPKFHDYKVYVFLNTLYLSDAERRRVDARVKRSEQIAIWLWGAGILTEAGISAEAAEKLIGSKVRMEKKETSLRVRVVEGNDPLTWGMHVGSAFGPERPVLPTLTVGDKTAARLGANTDNKTVFSVRREPTWTSVYYGTLPIPAMLLRNAFRAAGLHLYADTAGTRDEVIAGTRLVAATSAQGGTLRISLPAPHEIMDVTRQQKQETGSDIALKLAPGETRLLELKALPRKKDAP